MQKKENRIGKELAILILVSMSAGFVFFERMSVNYLFAHMEITSTQLGTLGSAFALAFAVGAAFCGSVIGKLGIKRTAAIFIILMGIVSFCQSLITSFAGLVALRILSGLVCGPVIPVAGTILNESISGKRRGLFIGIMQGLSPALFSATIAPVVLTAIADSYGWQKSYWVMIAPCIVISLLILKFYDPDAMKPSFSQDEGEMHESAEKSAYRDLFRDKTYPFSFLLSTFTVCSYVLSLTYMPSYLAMARSNDYTSAEQTLILTGLGFGGMLWGVLATGLSDKFGRKQILIPAYAICALGFLLVLGVTVTPIMLVAILTLTYTLQGSNSIAMSILPGDSLKSSVAIAKGIGFNQFSGEIIGGVGMMMLAGYLADNFSPAIPIYMAIGCAAVCLLLSSIMKNPSIH